MSEDRVSYGLETDSYKENSDILYTTEGFAVHTCVIPDPVLNTPMTVYGVYNTATRVREAEARQLTNAIKLCDTLSAAAHGAEAPQMSLALN